MVLMLAFVELVSSLPLLPFLSLVLAAQRGCYVRQVVVLPLCSNGFARKGFLALAIEI